MTKYIVLMKQGDGNRWTIIGQGEGHEPIRAAKQAAGATTGEFLAVPISNAHFISLDTEQPPPRTTGVLVAADTYLGEQLALDGAEPDPVAA